MTRGLELGNGRSVPVFEESELSRDAFLGGKIDLLQPKLGYRAGVDPVFLAASIAAKSGQSVLELGCGAAPALCCLGARVGDLDLTGVELQPAYAELAQRNLAENGLGGQIFSADLSLLPIEIKSRRYMHVIANPPYFDRAHGRRAVDAGRETALAGETPLSTWIEVAARRLLPGGYATFIQRIERLPEMLIGFSEQLGSVEVLPLAPRENRAPRLFLIRGRKEGRASFVLHPPLVLHKGKSHERDGEGYTDIIRGVLRNGLSINFRG